MCFRALTLLAAIAGCGRIAFEAQSLREDASGTTGTDAPTEDAFVAPTCGNGICEGNAGELCGPAGGSCIDCVTTNPVCGNAACDAGESTTCYADCGPQPWTWSSEEQALANLINTTRTTGHTCPGMVFTMRPAMMIVTTHQASAREWAWEAAHHDHYLMSSDACNGRTISQRMAAGGYTGFLAGYNYTDVTMMVEAWKNDMTLCPVLMGTTGQMSVAVAFDKTRAYIVPLK